MLAAAKSRGVTRVTFEAFLGDRIQLSLADIAADVPGVWWSATARLGRAVVTNRGPTLDGALRATLRTLGVTP